MSVSSFLSGRIAEIQPQSNHAQRETTHTYPDPQEHLPADPSTCATDLKGDTGSLRILSQNNCSAHDQRGQNSCVHSF